MDNVSQTAPCGAATTRARILSEANRLIHGDRLEEYGTPQESFGRIAQMWSAYLQIDVSAKDVTQMMCLLKIVRSQAGIKEDTFIDQAGYASLAGELALGTYGVASL